MGGSIKEKDLPSHISVIALSSIKGSMTEIPHDHGRPMLSRVFDVYKDSGEWKACSRLKKKKNPSSFNIRKTGFSRPIIKKICYTTKTHVKSTCESRRVEHIEVRVRQKQNMYHDSLGISTEATVCTLA